MKSAMQARLIRRARGSAHVDFYALVLGLGYAYGCRHQRLALAAAKHRDVIDRDAALRKIVSHALRSLPERWSLNPALRTASV